MQFSDDEWLAFAQKLDKATTSGRLDWERLGEDAQANEFIAIVPGNAVYTLASRDGDGEFPFILEVRDLDGEKISDFTTVAYSDGWNLPPDEVASLTIDRLYRRVTRNVSGSPERAKTLLDGLDALLPDEDAS